MWWGVGAAVKQTTRGCWISGKATILAYLSMVCVLHAKELLPYVTGIMASICGAAGVFLQSNSVSSSHAAICKFSTQRLFTSCITAHAAQAALLSGRSCNLISMSGICGEHSSGCCDLACLRRHREWRGCMLHQGPWQQEQGRHTHNKCWFCRHG